MESPSRVGAEILERVHFPYPVVPMSLSSREVGIGTGYPDGLAGEQIPMARAFCPLLDCLDALASATAVPAGPATRRSDADVAEQSGKSYDPRVVARAAKQNIATWSSKRKARRRTHLSYRPREKWSRGKAPATGFAERDVKSPAPAPSTDFSLAISNARRSFSF